ncbi:sulfotransferase [Paracoccus pantotrophus]|uniref:sulfotransferase n=1 Tax=Paracoccus pantotrophus TaxID=82367 RepID=UPI0004B37511|nr:sulfotransferase [Paracoccus pantotrophus]MDF3853886.1 sulfotransferase [Paracoccus pantotrophus]RNI15161.1 hypothetical protein EB844_17915 [Paracoccus pantotrophus]SFO55816.1 Sulfotransferase family protein [Paracoccus pantotrophus]
MDASLYPDLHAPKDGYVFVVTYGRSGSTLTQSLLNSIPGYCIRGENGNIPYFFSRAADLVMNNNMYSWRREDKGKDSAEVRPYLKDIIGMPFDPWAGAENVDPDDFLLSMMNLFVKKILQPDEGCRVSGFKEIRFHEDPGFFRRYLNIIRDTFPNARFLFQTRNLDSVSKSSWWAAQPKEKVVQQLRSAEKLYQEYSRENPSITFTIEYERYADGPEYVESIFEFLNEPYDPKMVVSVLNRSLKH